MQEDWHYDLWSPGRIILWQGETVGTTQAVLLQPYGAAVLSVYPDPSDPINWTMRVRIDAESDPPPRVRVFEIDSSGLPRLRHACQHDPDGYPGPAYTEMCQFQSWPDGQGGVTTAVKEPIAIFRQGGFDSDVDEVLVILSAGKEPVKFSWSIGDSQPYVNIIEPTSSQRAPIGHANAPLLNPIGAKPFLLQFEIADENNQPLARPLDDIKLEISDCAGGAYQLQPKQAPDDPDDDYFLHRFDPALYWAVVTVPDHCYPSSSGVQPDLSIRVSAIDDTISDEEEDALNVTATYPRVAMQLVLDKSLSMTPNKLQAAKIAGRLLIEGLADDDAVGVVSFEEDAWTNRNLLSNCSGTRQDAIEHLLGVESVACGRTSLGDGLLEAQANFAASFDQYSPYWDDVVLDCKPDTHAMVVLSDGRNNEPYAPSKYYDPSETEYMDPHDGPLSFFCSGNPYAADDDFIQGGWLGYPDRVTLGLRVPTISVVAFGQDADLPELQKLLDATSGGNVTYIEGPGDNTFRELMRMTVVASDQFRQGANAASGHERAGAWYAMSIQPEHMPALEVEPLTDELLVSVSSARDETVLLELVSPSGEIVEPVQKHTVATVFRVPDPEPGMWSWQLARQLPPTSPQDPPAVFVEQAVRGPLRLYAEADVTMPWPVPSGGGWYEDGRLAGSEVTIRAMPTTGAAILGATVLAEVTPPAGGSSILVDLVDDGLHGDAAAGDGVYGALLDDTFVAGVYQMRVIAKGISPLSGAPFSREKTLALHLHDGDDSDRDQLPDWWEIRYTSGLTALAALGDADMDGASNVQEYAGRTSPVRADSDGGGEADGSEIVAGRDPLDPADDLADIFEPAVAPGNGKTLLDLGIPFMLEASVELQRSDSPDGPWITRFAGVPPGDNLIADEAPNDVQACYRMSTITATAQSGWSAPLCVLPRIDPLPPFVSLRLATELVTRRDSEITVHIDAGDTLRLTIGQQIRGAFLIGDRPSAELFDGDIVESGLEDMMVSQSGTFEGTEWEPFEREVVIAVPGEDFFVIHVKVRDAAGNESEPVQLPVWIEDDWPVGQALVGLCSLVMKHDSWVNGSVVVVEASAEHGPSGIRLAHGATVDGSLRADSVALAHGAQVTGDVYYNQLSSSGSIAGELSTPLHLPVQLRLPRMVEVTPGETDLSLDHGQDATLEQGSYRDVVLAGGSHADPTVLVLAGGTYHMARVLMGKHARLECAAPCELRIAAELWLAKESYVGPQWADQAESDVGIFVAAGAAPGGGHHHGHHGCQHGLERAVTIGKDSVIRARIYAPTGKVRLKRGVQATGSFVGGALRVGQGAVVSASGR